MKSFSLILALLLSSAAVAAPDLDALLGSIKADIAAQRLSTPAGNNALERIQAFRQAAPFDFRVVPLAYAWGEANVRLANTAIDNKEYDKAQDYLDRVWQLAALTPNLEEVQDKLDRLSDGKASVATKPSKEELAQQQKLAQAAAKEKERVAAEQKRKKEADAKRLVEEKQKAEQEKARKQEAERQRRAELEREKKTAATPAPAPAPKVAAPAAPVAAVVTAAATATSVVVAAKQDDEQDVPKNWQELEETSKPIASFTLSAAQLENKDRGITEALAPICQAIVKDNASVVVHTADGGDYRWLTVRLTLCLRKIDKEFRLRHSHQTDLKDNQPYITLHPARDASLLKEITND